MLSDQTHIPNNSNFSKKPWCMTQEHVGTFWGQIGRGRCRLDCEGINLQDEKIANLATEVIIHSSNKGWAR